MFPIYFDEDSLNPAVIAAIRRLGVVCSGVGDAEQWGRTDIEQLLFASERGMSIYTTNARDFARIHRDWLAADASHAGIIVLSDQLAPIGLQIRAIENLQRTYSTADMKDRLVFLLNHAD